MKLKTLLLPFAALALCANAFAAPPSDASLERLFEVQRMESMLDQSFQGLQHTQNFVLSEPDIQESLRNIPEEKRPQVVAILKKYAEQSVADINTPKVRAQMRKVALEEMKAFYTQEEVNALIDFYSTPIGQSVLDKTPRYVEATVKSMMPIVMKHAQTNQGANAKMIREIYQIMCDRDNPAPACSTQPQKPARKK
ncbi:DUF2059 domain-containing protein [Neisseria elongata]|uniref:DUF2059 domain-containing protein n=1 Tax=Neisseria elongata TaxID=495 RepID=UPI0028E7FCD6|nr:DUF2059 domain-containing protein [Neisseria elongata]